MHIVTGGAGFIGSNIIRALNAAGSNDIVVVEDFSKGDKRAQLEGCRFQELMERKEFLTRIAGRGIGNVDTVFHQGACTDTMEHDARLMMELNLDTSQALLEWALRRDIPMVYASSAAVYGASTAFTEVPENEKPLNVYGESKLKFDHLVRRAMGEARATLVGLRYFNVYGPRESWKGRMASVAYHMYGQLRETGTVRLFVGTGGYGDGEQRRDFVHVDDIVAVNLFFARGPARHGIVNCGTGRSRSFNDVARALIAAHGSGKIEYVPLPDGLAERYQSFTEADLTGLRRLGYEAPFTDVEEGVRRYYRSLSAA
ncbi:MAG: ADP-glyceromanno-heptose 6-epimerase [Gemmatimonadales bacterium]